MLGSINFLKGLFENVRFLKPFFEKSNKGVVQESVFPRTLPVKGYIFSLTTKPRIACLTLVLCIDISQCLMLLECSHAAVNLSPAGHCIEFKVAQGEVRRIPPNLNESSLT